MPKTVQIAKPKKVKLTSEQKKENKKRMLELDQFGLALGDIASSQKQNRFYLCFIRAILIFMACFGMIGGMVSSFELPFSMPIVIIGLFLLALLSAFLYYNKVSFYVGYFIVFAGFIIFSFRFYWHINSGYQAFSNVVFNKYSDYFHLLTTREATEFIENRYLTVTAAMLFLGWFFSILLNITISGYMDLPMTFLLTFLPLQIPFYIDIVPPLPYLVLLISVYISVAVLGRSGHFTLPYRHNQKKQFFDRRRRKKETRHTYLASSHGMLNVAIYSVILSSLFLLLTSTIFSGDFNGKYVSNKVKDTTDRFMKAAVQNGIYSLFDRYNAKGGLAHGQLGGIGNVSPDFETDLIVRLVPYSSDNIYLKAYTGVTYDRNTFYPYAYDPNPDSSNQVSAQELDRKEADGYYPRLTATHDVTTADLLNDNDYYGKMWINNVDGEAGAEYVPYYTFYTNFPRNTVSSWTQVQSNEAFRSALDLLDSTETMDSYVSDLDAENKYAVNYEALYLPYSSALSYSPNPSMTEEYEKFVYDTYLQIPEDLDPVLDRFCEESGLNNVIYLYPTFTDHADHTAHFPANEYELDHYKQNQQYRLGVAAALKRYYAINFDYTMTPGTTPRDRDVVDYFLNNQKRGYCAHFASSATMILRNMGIPTRYCEGYMLPLTTIMDGTPISTDTEGWVSGTADLSDSGIVEVELTDAAAHAWIEIYLDGYGWIPYEMTPPSGEEPTIGLDFYDLFSGLMTQTRRSTETGNTPQNNLENADQIGNNIMAILSGLRFLYRPLLILLSLLILFLLSLPFVMKFRDQIRVRKLCSASLYGDALLYDYRKIVQQFRSKKLFTELHPTLRDFHTWLQSHQERFHGLHDDDVSRLYESLQYAAFAKQQITPEQYYDALHILQKLSKGMQKENK